MRVVIYLKLNDLQESCEVWELLKEYRDKIQQYHESSLASDPLYFKRRIERQKRIEEMIEVDKVYTSGEFYKRITHKGIRCNYKKFQRDIAEMIVGGLIDGEVVSSYKGKSGRTTLIKKKKMITSSEEQERG